MIENIAEDIVKRVSQLDSERQNYATFWQDVSKYCLPRKAYITRTRTPGQKYDYDIYDTTAMQANITLAAGLHSYLTNPNSKWFSLRLQDEQLNDNEEVKYWLQDTEERMYNALNASNFNQQIHELYLDLGVFGIACMYEEEDETDGLRFYSRDIAEIYLCENEKEKIDTVYRKFKYTARQAYDKWGDNAGEVVKTFMDKKEYDKAVEFIHCVRPRYERDVTKQDAPNMPFESTYIEVSKKHLINQSGYREFPYFTPRFNKNSGEVWGSSPAMVLYADIKMLNEMVKVLIRSAQKQVDPPLVLPHDGYLLPIKYGPAALNFRLKGSADDKIEPLATGANISIGLEIIGQWQSIVKKGYFVDLFLLLADPARKDMTATEVMQRVEEKMLILAPVLGRLMNEFLDPLITRTFNILWRTGKLMPPPEVIQNMTYKIEYISPLARAQKLDQMKSINSFIALVNQIAVAKPDVMDNVNEDEMVNDVQDLYGVNPKYLRSKEQVTQIRDQRAQMQMQMAQMQQAQQAADVVATGASAGADIAQANQQSKPGGPSAAGQ
jgi:hypothetical protein